MSESEVTVAILGVQPLDSQRPSVVQVTEHQIRVASLPSPGVWLSGCQWKPAVEGEIMSHACVSAEGLIVVAVDQQLRFLELQGSPESPHVVPCSSLDLNHQVSGLALQLTLPRVVEADASGIRHSLTGVVSTWVENRVTVFCAESSSEGLTVQELYRLVWHRALISSSFQLPCVNGNALAWARG